MRPLNKYIISVLVLSLFACQTQRKMYQLYKMNEFNVNAGNDFVKRIQYLQGINEISIVDTKADGNDFIVDRQWIFLDTTHQNQPNYYNVKKRANELNVPVDSLTNCLQSFYKIGVNDFSRDSNYYRFRVVVGLTTNRGYIYSDDYNIKAGDTLPAISVRNKEYHFKIVLTRRIKKNWFEYYETR